MTTRTNLKQPLRHVFVALLTGLVLTTIGCGYSSQGLLRDDIHSVAIPVFDNETDYRELEVELTRKLSEEIRQSTSLEIQPRNRADSILSGAIVGFDSSNETETEDEEVLMRRIVVTVEFRWTDNLTGQDLVSPVEFSHQSFFALSRKEPIAPRVFEDTAEKIVEEMERSW